MESGPVTKKRNESHHVSWLHLHERILQKDIRQLIYALLGPEDREVVACAHNKQRVPCLTEDFSLYCARSGFVVLLEWALSNKSGMPCERRCVHEECRASAASSWQLHSVSIVGFSSNPKIAARSLNLSRAA
jgi:hypothetical protein